MADSVQGDIASVSFQIVLGPVELVEEIDSTNAELLRRARAGAPGGMVLVADHQTSGRGRLDRSWESAQGASLLVSVLLRPELPPSEAHLLTFAAGLAAVDACAAVAGVGARLKWPNDLVIVDANGTRKLAGLLAETILEGNRMTALVLGMGLNVRAAPLPAGAVSLAQLCDREIEPRAVLVAWLAAFDERLTSLDPLQIVTDYRDASATLGTQVRVELGASTLEGRAVDVTPAGHLVVATSDGTHTVSTGDVVHLRPV